MGLHPTFRPSTTYYYIHVTKLLHLSLMLALFEKISNVTGGVDMIGVTIGGGRIVSHWKRLPL